MNRDDWGRISIENANALNDLADTLQYVSATAGHRERRHRLLMALKDAFELGVRSTTHVSATNTPAANE